MNHDGDAAMSARSGDAMEEPVVERPRDSVSAAFDLLLEEIDLEIERLNETGVQSFREGNYPAA